MAVPVRADLRRHLHHAEQALDRHVRVHVRQQADYLFAMGAALPNLGRMLDYASQRLEDLAFRHEKSLHVMFGNLSRQRLRPLGLRLRPPAQLIQRATEQLRRADGRRLSALPRLIGRCDLKMHSVTARLQPERFARDMVASREVLNLFQQRINYRIAERVNRSALELHSAARLLEHADYRKVLARGFALVTDATGKHPLTNAAMVQAGESLRLEFHDGVRMAVASEDGAVMPAPRRGKRPAKSSMLEKTPIQPEPAQAACDDGQGVLF
jgi:exodeoxyribonuclease VII large subunit